MLKKKLFFIVLLLVSLGVFGQKSKTAKIDTTYIKSYRYKILLKANYEYLEDTYTIKNNSLDESVLISSNAIKKIFFSFDYDFIGISIGFSPSVFNKKDENLKGETSYFNLNIRAFLGNWVQGFKYTSTKGYFLKSTSGDLPEWIEGIDPYKQLPNLRNIEFSGYTSFVVNPKFSIKNLLFRTEKQIKSTGSLLPTLKYKYNHITNYSDISNSVDKIFDLEFSLGYYYTFVLNENWFVSPGVSGAIGPRFSNVEITNQNQTFRETKTYFIRELDTGLQVGYDNGKIVFGGRFDYFFNADNGDVNYKITNDKYYGLVYLGFRLNASKKFNKPFDWVHKTINLSY